MSIFVDTVPGLVDDFDSMALCGELEGGRPASCCNLERNCWVLDRQLEAWLDLVRQRGQGARSLSTTHLVTRIGQVHGMTLYWTTALVLYSILWAVSNPDESLPERTNPMNHARRLVAAIAILIQPDAGLYGKQSAALPVEVARQWVAAMEASQEKTTLMAELERLRMGLVDG